jgi:hypothetical protein
MEGLLRLYAEAETEIDKRPGVIAKARQANGVRI